MNWLKSKLSNWFHNTSELKLYLQLGVILAITITTFAVIYALKQRTPPTSSNAADIMPASVIEGTVRIKIFDDFANKKYSKKYFLESTANGVFKRSQLNYSGNKNLKSGDYIRLDGYTNTNNIISATNLTSGSDGLTIISHNSPTAIAPTGNLRVAVILVNFADQLVVNISRDYAYTYFRDNVIPHLQNVSYNKLNPVFSASDVYPNTVIPLAYSCENFKYMDQFIKGTDVDAKVNFNNYDHIIFVARIGACDAVGVSDLGTTVFDTNDGLQNKFVANIASQSYDKYVINHEMGHGFGAGHSGGLECGSQSFLEGNCPMTQNLYYADEYDPMGGSRTYLNHFGPYYKRTFNWISDANFKTVTSSGNYDIYPIESYLPSYVQGLKINRIGSEEFFTVENRTQIGYDSSIPAANLTGAIIKKSMPAEDLVKIDSTPNSNSGWPDFADGDWETNQTFNDCHGVKITSLGKSTVNNIANVMKVNVELNPNATYPIFHDVSCMHPYFNSIETLYKNGYTAGCSNSPLSYCPEQILDRAQAAVFIARGNFGGSYTPPPATHIFADDWSNYTWAEPWAEAIFNNGLSAGCQTSPLLYCPSKQLTKEEVAVFALRLKYGSAYKPPPATGTLFYDMTNASYWATAWAEQAYKENLLSNCGFTNGKPKFCPTTLVSRGLAADVVVKAKNLK